MSLLSLPYNEKPDILCHLCISNVFETFFEFVWNHLGLHIREEASLNFPRISLVLVLSLASCTTIWGTGFIHYRGRPNYFDLFSPSSGTAEYGWTVSVEYKYNLHISAFARAHVSRWLDIRRVKYLWIFSESVQVDCGADQLRALPRRHLCCEQSLPVEDKIYVHK